MRAQTRVDKSGGKGFETPGSLPAENRQAVEDSHLQAGLLAQSEPEVRPESSLLIFANFFFVRT